MNKKLVRDLQDDKYTLVQDSYEVDQVIESLGLHTTLSDHRVGCLLVEVLDGEYGEVWAIDSFIPRLNETAYLIN